MTERFAGRFALLRRLGQGGMGDVYLARDLDTGAECALKRRAPMRDVSPQALRREFEALTRVSHPGVVAVHELGFAPDGAPWLTMDYVPGLPADAAVAPGDATAAAVVAIEMLHALEALHAAGVVHGDLKPANVLVVRGGAGAPPSVRLVDFGLAALAANEMGYRGTRGFAAPEVVEGAPPSPVADLYGVGATLFAVLAGRPPFVGDDGPAVLRAQAAGPPPAMALEQARVPRSLVPYVLRLLAPDPVARPADARAARLELERLVPAARRPLVDRLRTVRVVGRARELARIESWIASAREREPGRERVLAVTGPAGAGKSTLLREVAARVTLAGRVVVSLSCAAFDRPGGVARAIARRLAAACGDAPVAEPGTAAARDLGDLAGDVGVTATRLAARSGPSLIALDDFEALDAASAAWIRRLALDDETPLLWLWGYRALAGEARESERVMTGTEVLERIALEPLTEDDSALLAAARLGHPAPEALARFVWNAAAGHPGLSVAWLEAAAREGLVTEHDLGLRVDETGLGRLRVPAQFEEALLERLAALDADARAVASALAVVGAAVDEAALAQLVPAADAPSRAALVAAGLATRDVNGRLALHPPALAPRLRRELDGDARRALHRAAARLPGVEPARAFRHHAAAGDADAALAAAESAWTQTADPELAARAAATPGIAPVEAARWLERAARGRMESGRYAAAIPELERALELDPDATRRAARWERLSTACLRAGRSGTPVLERARADGVGGAMLAIMLGNEASRLHTAGRQEEAVATAGEAILMGEAVGDATAVGIASLLLAWHALWNGRPDEAESHGRRAAESFGDRDVVGGLRVAGLRAGLARARGRLEEAERLQREAVTLARGSGRRLALAEQLAVLVSVLLESGRWHRLQAPAAEAVRLAIEDGRAHEAAVALAMLAQIEGLVGKAFDARRHARAALRLAAKGERRAAAEAWRALAQAERIAGRPRAAERAARRAIETALGVSNYDVDWGRLEFGRVCADAGRWVEALESWRRVLDKPASADPLVAGLVRVHAARAALRGGGDGEEPARVAATSARAPMLAANVLLLRAELALLQKRPADAVEAGRAALAAFEALPAPAEVASAALDLALFAPDAPALRDAVAGWLDVAARGFERLGDRGRRARALGHAVEVLRRPGAGGPSSDQDTGLVERVTWLLNSLTDIGELTQRSMRAAVEQLGAERGVLLLADEKGILAPMAEYGAVDPGTRSSALGYSTHVVAHVAESGAAVLIADAPVDPRAKSKSVEDMRILSILCVPLFVGGKIVGAVYLDDSRRAHQFGEPQRRLLEGFAHLMAVAIEKAQGHEEVRRTNELLEGENLSLRQEIGARLRSSGVVGTSTPMQRILGMVEHAARTNTTVLITGENGTGKELIARTLHHSGRRAMKPFLAVNCGAIPEPLIESELFGILANVATGVRQRQGRFVQASGGTLFLDEIGEMPLKQQVALLSAIANREITPVGGGRPILVDVRIIAATNQNLRRQVEKGEFREDLYYRLNVIEIEVPPLRDRKADIPALAHHFLEVIARQQEREVPQLSPDFLAVLMQSDWPGNVRELQNYVERVLAMTPGRVVHPDPMPRDLERRGGAAPRLPRGRRLLDTVDEIERKLVGEALERARGNQSHAARELGITEQAMRYRLRKYGIASARRNRRIRQK